uniref:Telomeric repeat binding factor 1 n=1 Tax=Sphenodon punctatus TaxID=8508 RepID=A0A8D0HM05_SPHPU
MFWNPESASSRTKHRKTNSLQSKKELQNIENSLPDNLSLPACRKRRRWTWEEDQKLKEGVKKFGVGKWTKILLHYNFNNRTDVMLKDRWRTMAKLNII